VISLSRQKTAARAAWLPNERRGSLDRTLIAAGLDPRVVASVRQDLVDEFEQRLARDGVLAARGWYAREGVCSLFALVRYAMASSFRMQCFVAAASVLLAATALLAVRARPGAPDRILLNMPTLGGALIVNAIGGEQIRARIVDARGHALASRDLQFRIREGEGVSISPSGRVDCHARTDATMAVSFGNLETNIPLACRPVRTLSADRGVHLIASGNARPLPFAARDANGNLVRQLRGSTRIDDTTIATAAGGRVRAKRPGQTAVAVDVGNQAARIRVVAHRLVEQFTDDMRRSQFQAVPVRLSAGESHRWSLPTGAFWLTYIPNTTSSGSPLLEVSGAHCSSRPGESFERGLPDANTIHCVVAHAGAMAVMHAGAGADGALALEWEIGPRSLP
jgi:hypothetical protein